MRFWTAGILLTIALGSLTEAQAQERHVLGRGDVAIYNLAGRVTIEPGTGSDVTVEVRRGGPDAGRLQIATGEVRGRQTLRVVYPGDQIVYPEMGRGSNTTLRVSRDGTFGDRTGNARKVRIQGSGRGDEAFADLVVRAPRGSRVTVHQAVGGVEARDVEADLVLDTHSATVTTERTRGHLKIDAGSGAVQVADAAGEVEVDGGSGRLQLAGVRGPRLLVDMGSGAVTGSDIVVDRLDVDIGSGSTRLHRVGFDEGMIDTGSGSVDLELTRSARSLDIDSGSGDVRLAVPAGFGAEMEADTGSGGIDVDVPVTTTERERSYFRGRIGEGGGRVRIDTGSGSVRVVRGG